MAHNYDYSPYEDQCIPNLSQISSTVPLFTDPAVYHLTSYGVSPNYSSNGKPKGITENKNQNREKRIV